MLLDTHRTPLVDFAKTAILIEQDNGNNTIVIGVTLGVGVPYSTGGPRPGI